MSTNSFTVKHCVCNTIPLAYVPSPAIQCTKASQVNNSYKLPGKIFLPSK